MPRSSRQGPIGEGETRAEREALLQSWLGGQLRQRGRKMPPTVWKRLMADGRLDDVLDIHPSELTREALLEDARTYLLKFRNDERRRKTRIRRQSGRVAVRPGAIAKQIDLRECLSKEEIKRAQVLSLEMVRIAMKARWDGPETWGSPDRPQVPHFRDRVLLNRVPTEAEAQRLLKSIGAALFELEFFEEHGIPVLDHSAELTSGFDWEAPDSHKGLTPRSEVTFRWGTQELVAPLGDRARHVHDGTSVFGPIWRGEEPVFLTTHNSIHGWLDGVAGVLTFLCPLDRWEAAMFVLRSTVPAIMPIDMRMTDYARGDAHALTRVSLIVHPWVSAKALMEFYQRLQRILIGQRNRSPELESLELFGFVSAKRHSGCTFSEILAAWLKKNPRERGQYDRADATSVERFANKFRDIERQVLRPYGHPDDGWGKL